jgi:hypothetical protein
MRQRFLSAVILFVALVTSAAGTLLATVLCPNSGRTHELCHEAAPQSSSSHSGNTHEMHGMSNHDSPIPIDAADMAAWNGIEQPFDTCSHCITHSNLPRSARVLRQVDTVRSVSQIDASEISTNIPYVVLTPRVVIAREHAPPAPSSPLHVRNSVFRI